MKRLAGAVHAGKEQSGNGSLSKCALHFYRFFSFDGSRSFLSGSTGIKGCLGQLKHQTPDSHFLRLDRITAMLSSNCAAEDGLESQSSFLWL